MTLNDLLARQRRALRAFRQAEARLAEQVAECFRAEQVVEFSRSEQKAKAEAFHEKQKAKAGELLARARERYEKGWALLEREGLAHLLDKRQPQVEPRLLEADPMAELARNVKTADEAVADLDKYVRALTQYRQEAKKLPRKAALSIGAGCLYALLFGFLGSIGGCVVGLFSDNPDKGTNVGCYLGIILGLIVGIYSEWAVLSKMSKEENDES